MHEDVRRLVGAFVAVDDHALREEFDAQLAESTRLAFRVAYSVLRHQAQAEDVAQDALMRAFRAFRSLRDHAKFRSWLVRLTWRLALDEQRSTRRRLARDGVSLETSHRTQGRWDPRADQLWAAINRLPPRFRQPLVLVSVEGYSVREVAALLGIPEGTVKSRLFEARRRLKEWLK